MLTRRDLLRSIPSAALMAMGPAFPAHADGALGKLPVTDPMEDLKTILEVVLAEVPVVGGAMSALVGLLGRLNLRTSGRKSGRRSKP
ncbi:hypothetical protein [Cupriavidus pinatubonensis]|uniref:hypothetical protein n=1 Tax=Cupriavidus pinatubonensis TaxID=248026 RepID=UPI002159E7EC|nr:hypothetical protein [Cupriavidus pinatubonensis]